MGGRVSFRGSCIRSATTISRSIRPAYRKPRHPRGRVIVIAPTRAACETIELALGLDIETLLEQKHGPCAARAGRARASGFGIVAGTGTGKTLAIRPIAEEILGRTAAVGVVNREREATPETPSWNVVIVTTGIARRWFQDGDIIAARDTLIVDEIHQTSAELELCLALGKRAGCRFIWLSATVDPTFYAEYLEQRRRARDLRLRSQTAREGGGRAQGAGGVSRRAFLRQRLKEKRGVAVFVPTRAGVEQAAGRYRRAVAAHRQPRSTTAASRFGSSVPFSRAASRSRTSSR